MYHAAPDPRRNHLLAAVPLEEWSRWLPQLKSVDLPLGQVIFESGASMSHVYFPTTGIISLLQVMKNGATAGIAAVGQEGLVGTALLLGSKLSYSRAVVQSAGQGFRMQASGIQEECRRLPVLNIFLRYAAALMTQTAQTIVCNRHHSVDQQLCRCLLSSLDRTPGTELVMTQELIATVLGVRRESVTASALKLQKAGLISYARGRISILDRPRLQERSCECYEVVRKDEASLGTRVRFAA